MKTMGFAVMAAMLLVGCVSVPYEHFYTLISYSNEVRPASTLAPAITIASVTIPEAVDRSELIVRNGPNRVALLENERWAESLRTAIPRVIAGEISQALGGLPVSVQSDNAGRDAKYLIYIDITRFESALGDSATIDALWSIRTAAGTTATAGKSTFRIPVQEPGYDPLVAAHTLALAKLADDIAAQIKQLGIPGK